MTKINISIPKPCHENWQAMTPENKGRFCDSCQKKVFDFTSSSDREIVKAFEKDNNLCGRFLNTQLERDLVIPKDKSTIWLATTTALISLIGVNDAVSQEKAPTEQTDQRMLGKFIVTPAPIPAVSEEIEVSGIVTDSNGEPLPGVNILSKGLCGNVITDFDGRYKLVVKKGEVLLFNYIGFKDINLTVSKDSSNLNVQMTEQVILEGLVYYKKPTFFGRLFHRIGNLFR